MVLHHSLLQAPTGMVPPHPAGGPYAAANSRGGAAAPLAAAAVSLDCCNTFPFSSFSGSVSLYG